MRLWSIHPSYLDTKGLVAVWREGLLAFHVLQGKTKGYKSHPQLIRFQNHPEPIQAISEYLHVIVDEAEKRNFSFKREKLLARKNVESISLTLGQVHYEAEHLQKKLEKRDSARFLKHTSITQFKVHPLFSVISGEVESWEKIT